MIFAKVMMKPDNLEYLAIIMPNGIPTIIANNTP